MRFLLLFISLSLGIVGQFFLKKGVVDSHLAANAESLFKTVFSPFVFSGLVLYGISALVWLFVLKKFPLSVAYPTLALSYVVIVLLGAIFIDEPLTKYKLVGIVLIVSGVYYLYQ